MSNSKMFVDEVVDIYNGHQFVVKLQRRGHRCGYVRVNDSALFEKIKQWYDAWDNCDFDFDVHGGITFVSDIEGQYLPPGAWIGFDCAHCDDLPDIPAAVVAFDLSEGDQDDLRLNYRVCYYPGASVCSADYVRVECYRLINQLIKYNDTMLEKEER